MALGAPPGNFQVRFGINVTALTRALEAGDFRRAYNIIEENISDPDFFNDGPYERFPLYIVLCGRGLTSEDHVKPRNLHMAKVLIERGADPNLRVPVFNSQWMLLARQFSQSPMELLLDFYLQCLQLHVKDRLIMCSEITTSDLLHAVTRWHQDAYPVVGLNQSTKLSFAELREQLLELMDSFIVHGAEVNVFIGDTPALVRVLLTYPDLEFTEKLCSGGADLTLADCHGNTPLMAACRPKSCKLQNKLRMEQDLQDVVHYLIRFDQIDLNAVNCMNQSALWYLFSVGNINLACTLIKVGADPSIAGVAYTPSGPKQRNQDVLIGNRIAAVLMALTRSLSSSFVYEACWRRGELPFSLSKDICALVDSDLLNRYIENLEISLLSLLTWNQHIAVHQKMLEKLKNRDFLIPSLLGNVSLSLRQRCARTIFSCCIHSITSKYNLSDEKVDQAAKVSSEFSLSAESAFTISCLETIPEDLYSVPVFSAENKALHLKSSFTQKIFSITSQDLEDVVQQLCLPLQFITFLEFELYRWKILLMLSNSHYDRIPCFCEADSAMDSFSDVDSDISFDNYSVNDTTLSVHSGDEESQDSEQTVHIFTHL